MSVYYDPGYHLTAPGEPLPQPPSLKRQATSEQEARDEAHESETHALSSLLQFDDTLNGSTLTCLDGAAGCTSLAHSLLVIAGKLELRVGETESQARITPSRTKALRQSIQVLKALGQKMCKVLRVDARVSVIKIMSKLPQEQEIYGGTYKGEGLESVCELCRYLTGLSEGVARVGGEGMERYVASGVDLLLEQLFLRCFRYAERRITHVGADAVAVGVREVGSVMRGMGWGGMEGVREVSGSE